MLKTVIKIILLREFIVMPPKEEPREEPSGGWRQGWQWIQSHGTKQNWPNSGSMATSSRWNSTWANAAAWAGKLSLVMESHDGFSGMPGARVLDPKKKGTGLFPKINNMIKDIVTAFIKEEQPDVLLIWGDDSKRNEVYSRYSSWCPANYSFKKIIVPDVGVAAKDGTVAVYFLKDGAEDLAARSWST